MTDRPYHHGDLRRAALAATVDAIKQDGGTAALRMREVARRVGVSHAAFNHHFGTKPGLLAALAAEGYDLLAEALTAADGGLVDAGVAYVRFAAEYPAHFEVMFHRALHNADDPQLIAAQERAGQALTAVLSTSLTKTTELAAWSIVHGFADLWVGGALPAGIGADAGNAARPVIRRLSFTP
ncbi:TetR/AcrR family transcriptional regulator [Pseudonocardia cypriaca]|uniref:TetR family transcriptional regulator n=1 Tax=Pseudonocardia cypriaca TaxID=882449 RepID=A0A543FT01_9PSEU|nr:TetR/AcrR family transcriptional regulator [Pseudonocardia cypriaca]TQM36942.1 TetR family transcriptional regulator [Pseudonocardia cypriaca]